MNSFGEVITALVTPFYQDEIDEKSFIRLLHQQMENGVRGFVLAGTTGESPTLSIKETQRLFEVARGELGADVPLIIGTGSNSTKVTIEKTRLAEKWGADAALLVVPYYNRPPQRGIERHFATVAENVGLPLLLYNVPSRTGCSLEAATVVALAEEKNIIGIKEASGDFEVLQQLQKISHRPFWLFSGDDASGIEFCRRGGHGIISVVSHLIPRELKELVTSARAGDADVAQRYAKFADLLRWLYVEANPIPVKWALQKMGVIRSAEVRLPLVSLDECHWQGLTACLKQLGKI